MATLYLRTQEGETIADIEIIHNGKEVQDLHSVVIIDSYSKLLINNLESKDYLISKFESLSELRGWFFEWFILENAKPSLQETEAKIINDYGDLLKKFSLCWIQD